MRLTRMRLSSGRKSMERRFLEVDFQKTMANTDLFRIVFGWTLRALFNRVNIMWKRQAYSRPLFALTRASMRAVLTLFYVICGSKDLILIPICRIAAIHKTALFYMGAAWGLQTVHLSMQAEAGTMPQTIYNTQRLLPMRLTICWLRTGIIRKYLRTTSQPMDWTERTVCRM